jgi:hypothetical protein
MALVVGWLGTAATTPALVGLGARPHRRHGAGDRAPGEAAEACVPTLPVARHTFGVRQSNSRSSFGLEKARVRSYFPRGSEKS